MSQVTPTSLVEALKDWGVDAVPWEPDGQPWHAHTTAGGWAPIGVLHHHTTGPAEVLTSTAWVTATLKVLRDGRKNLVGPLCHLAPAMNPATGKARVWLIGWGNTNHAGMGCSDIDALVRRGVYTPRKPGPDDADGNPLYWGLEYVHPGGSTPWPDALLDAGHRAAAAICDAEGWHRDSWGGSQIEHRQRTARKPDRSWTGSVQDAVHALALGITPTTTTQEDAMAVVVSAGRYYLVGVDGYRYINQPAALHAALAAAGQTQAVSDGATELLAELPDLDARDKAIDALLRQAAQPATVQVDAKALAAQISAALAGSVATPAQVQAAVKAAFARAGA
jgi:hypothetical protein